VTAAQRTLILGTVVATLIEGVGLLAILAWDALGMGLVLLGVGIAVDLVAIWRYAQQRG
jgi:hypothetical protein